MTVWVTRQSWRDGAPEPDADRSAPCTGARLGTRGDGQQAWFVRLSSLDELLAFVAARLMPVTIEPDPYTEGEMMAEIRDLWS